MARELGLVFLLDLHNSDYFALISKGPLKGLIMYLGHSDNSAITQRDLSEFLAVPKDDDWEDGPPLRPAQPILAAQPREMAEYCRELAGRAADDEDAVALLCVVLDCLDHSDLALWESLARHDDFYIAEAVGLAIERNPRPELAPAARLLTEHPHSQVVGAGRRALQAIARL